MSFELKQLLDLFRADERPVAHRHKGAIFTEPLLVAEIDLPGVDEGQQAAPLILQGRGEGHRGVGRV